MSKILSYCKDNAWGLAGFILNPIGTILYLGCVVSFYETDAGFRLTFWGILALLLVGIIVMVKVNGKFKQMQHGVARGLLLSILPMLVWVGGFFLVWTFDKYGDMAMEYWLIAVVFFIASRFCYIMHEIKKSPTTNENEKSE